MERAIFFHFLKTKAEEEEENNGYNNNQNNPNTHVYFWEVIEKRSNDVAPPRLLELFPWEIKKVLRASDLNPDEGLELSFNEAWDYIIQHMEEFVAANMIDYGYQVPIKIRDMDTNSEHNVSLKKAINSNRFYIQGRNWFTEFVLRRRLREGTMVGMYRDNKTFALRFSVLDSD